MKGYTWQLLPTGGFLLMHADAPVCTIRPAHRGNARRYACTYRGVTHWRTNWTDLQKHMERLIQRFADTVYL